MCAGLEKGGKDACQGDSGSPMMIVDDRTKRWTEIGIVSAGIGCALPKLPGIYTRTSWYLNWIQEMIEKYDNELSNTTTTTTQTIPTTTVTETNKETTKTPTTATPEITTEDSNQDFTIITMLPINQTTTKLTTEKTTKKPQISTINSETTEQNKKYQSKLFLLLTKIFNNLMPWIAKDFKTYVKTH